MKSFLSKKSVPFKYFKFEFGSKKLEKLQTEKYIQFQSMKKEEIDLNVDTNKKFVKRDYQRGLAEDEKPIPCSPVLGPITVENPKISQKKYRWCACGMSLKQPFCDGSHKGTNFHPVRFTIEEVCKKIELCGCKFTTNAPFCDQKSCKEILQKEETEKNDQ